MRADMSEENEKNKKQEIAVPVIEEDLVTGTREVKSGSVRVRKKVERIRKTVDMPVLKDVVRVSRVPVNRLVKTMPQTREERGMWIVPVVEEQIIVTRRLVLKEEIHIVRKQVQEQAHREVSVAREHAFVDRLDSEGNVVATSKPAARKKQPSSFFKQKGVL